MDAVITNRRYLTLFGGILIAFLFYPLVRYLAFSGHVINLTVVFYSRIFIWLEVAILFIYARYVEKDKVLPWPEKRYGFWFYPASIGALFLLRIGAGLIGDIPKLFGVPENFSSMERTFTVLATNMPLMVFMMVTAGIGEEFIFRGYMLPRLELVFKNKYMPVIVSSLMFSALHFHYHSLNEVIFAFFFGVAFAIHYQWYHNIKVLMVTHIIVDFVAFYAFQFLQHYHLPIK